MSPRNLGSRNLQVAKAIENQQRLVAAAFRLRKLT